MRTKNFTQIHGVVGCAGPVRWGSVTNIDSQARRLGRRAHVSLGRHHGLTQSQISVGVGSNMGHGLRSELLVVQRNGMDKAFFLSLACNSTTGLTSLMFIVA